MKTTNIEIENGIIVVTTKTLGTINNVEALRSSPNDPAARECFVAPANEHKFKPGDVVTLIGLVDFPEFNGQQVTITNIRKDGPKGKAYYIKGAINKFVNWVYEYRLTQ